MKGLSKILIERLKSSEKLTILGVGSFLNADDAAGLIIAENLKKLFKETGYQNLKVLIGEINPENCSEEIIQFKTDHLLIIDVVDVLQEPGSITVIKPDIITGVSYINHILPVRILVEYLKKETRCGITIIGMQPANTTYGGKVTEKVAQSIENVSNIIKNVIVGLGLGIAE